MIRATRGRSSRPNHMPSHLDAWQTTGPVDFRRGPGDFHSVAKQASFSIAFWSNFGGLGRPKSMPKFDFRAFFFDVIFESVLTSKFGWFWEAKTRKLAIFLRKNNDFYKIDVFHFIAKFASKMVVLRVPNRCKIQENRRKNRILKQMLF